MKPDRYTKVVLTVIAVALMWLCMQAPWQKAEAKVKPSTPKLVRAQKFDLVDAQGRVRAVLSVNDKGSPELRLVDKEGRGRATLGLQDDGSPGLALWDEGGMARTVLDVWVGGGYGLSLRDKDGKAIWSAP